MMERATIKPRVRITRYSIHAGRNGVGLVESKDGDLVEYSSHISIYDRARDHTSKVLGGRAMRIEKIKRQSDVINRLTLKVESRKGMEEYLKRTVSGLDIIANKINDSIASRQLHDIAREIRALFEDGQV